MVPALARGDGCYKVASTRNRIGGHDKSPCSGRSSVGPGEGRNKGESHQGVSSSGTSIIRRRSRGKQKNRWIGYEEARLAGIGLGKRGKPLVVRETGS